VPPDPGTRPYGLDYVYMVVRRRVRLNARPPLKEVTPDEGGDEVTVRGRARCVGHIGSVRGERGVDGCARGRRSGGRGRAAHDLLTYAGLGHGERGRKPSTQH